MICILEKCADDDNYCTNGDCIIQAGHRTCVCYTGFVPMSKSECVDKNECKLEGTVIKIS